MGRVMEKDNVRLKVIVIRDKQLKQNQLDHKKPLRNPTEIFSVNFWWKSTSIEENTGVEWWEVE